MNWDNLPILNYKKQSYRTKIAIVFMVSGLFMSLVGFLIGVILQTPMIFNIPHILVFLWISIVNLFFPERIEKMIIRIMTFSAIVYFPFLYFVNGGFYGGMPIYFVLIIVYLGIYLKLNKSVQTMTWILGIYYALIMVFSYYEPNYVLAFPDEESIMIDNLIGMLVVGINIVVVSRVIIRSYIQERDDNVLLVAELADKNAQLRELSITDSLTGLYNRRFFMETLTNQLAFMKETKDQITIAMIDIDWFKVVNDTWGHLYGDLVLKEISAALLKGVRHSDVVARYGGEEFVLLLQYSTKEHTLEMLERIRTIVENLKHRENHTITISIGATSVSEYEDPESILKCVDDYMYQAKEAGRNKVIYKSSSIS